MSEILKGATPIEWLSYCCEVFGRPILSEGAATAYLDDLTDDPESLREAFSQAIKYARSFPLPVELREWMCINRLKPQRGKSYA
ncbi:hypothetical protein P3W66_11870 [Achromobacter denitrificans]|uniref:hypothetical protein n=1 Tax=Achromobacter denitrificans TaxID=32002 RepID=UPI0023E80F26|nr:hypothetical protein [Achromobacter denitrificans]MDF3940731.1 hypothetical protein [Achromobacter denitrificans]